MNRLFPDMTQVTFSRLGEDGTSQKKWTAPELNMTTNIVCKPCNEGWMSKLENDFARPAMTDLIIGKRVAQLSAKRIKGLSLFAFKTAIIANRSLPESEFFFSKSARYGFRDSLAIPADVSMYLVGLPNGTQRGQIASRNIYFPVPKNPELTLNVCSFFVGQLGFQVVSAKAPGPMKLQCIPAEPNLIFRFYPTVECPLSWPRNKTLSPSAFFDFGNRWNATRRL
jgi:hypothetical protein